jgi:outer membrane receptor protein involved in Fe transport
LTDAELAKLAEQSATQQEEVITVTGSLIDRREIDTPSPIAVVDRQKMEAAGVTNIGSILQQLPSQGNALNGQNNNGGDGSVRINLRSLGDQRTLTLLDGRRMVPSGLGADVSVDLGTIPLAMVERIEVLKDSSAATYGSDAIAGVVNIITRQDFNGTDVTVYTATSQHGDGTNYDLSFVTGHSSKKGNITFSAGYQNQDAVMAGSRDFSKQIYAYNFFGQQTGGCGVAGKPVMLPNGQPGPGAPCASLSGSSAGPNGYLNTDPMNGGPMDADYVNVPGCNFGPGTNPSPACTYNPATGTWRPYKFGSPSAFNDDYNFQPLNYLFTPSTRVNVFGTGHYDISKNTQVFFQASYNERQSAQQLASEPMFPVSYGINISQFSMYNPFGAGQQYGADQTGGNGVQLDDYRRRLIEFGPRTFNQNVNTARVVAGLQGKVDEDSPVFKNWKWELSYNYGRVDSSNSNYGDLILDHLSKALGPSMMVNGVPTCVSTPGDATTAIPGCVPLNIMTPGNVTQAMINYLAFTGIASGFNEQHNALVQAHGKIVDLPNNGDISMAIGGDYRHEQGGLQPDPLTSTGDTTGNVQAPTEGSYHAFEGFAELSIVPIAHVKGAQWVEIDAAGRVFDYNIKDASGKDNAGATGKISGIWRTEGGLSFRGTYGTSFRAPAVAELYSGQAQAFTTINDPCDTHPPSGPVPAAPPNSLRGMECQKEISPLGSPNPLGYQNYVAGTAQQIFETGGNPHLQPETAVTGTVGGVWEPLKGLAFTVDYWNINITNAIEAYPAATVFNNCYFGGQQNFCGLIHRDPTTHQITKVFDLETNIGGVVTSGLDMSGSYTKKVGAHTYRASLEVDQLFKYNANTGGVDPNHPNQELVLHGRNYYDLGVLPEWRGVAFGEWTHKSGFGAGANIRYVGDFFECNNDNCNAPGSARRDVGAYATADLFVDYMVKSKAGTTRLTVGCNNVPDVQPRIIYNGGALNSDESAYDFMGRYYYFRLSHLF